MIGAAGSGCAWDVRGDGFDPRCERTSAKFTSNGGVAMCVTCALCENKLDKLEIRLIVTFSVAYFNVNKSWPKRNLAFTVDALYRLHFIFVLKAKCCLLREHWPLELRGRLGGKLFLPWNINRLL